MDEINIIYPSNYPCQEDPPRSACLVEPATGNHQNGMHCLHFCQVKSLKGEYCTWSKVHDSFTTIGEHSWSVGSIDPNQDDLVNHPKHYTEHPSGVECIQITEHMNFNLGNAMKYIWRADYSRKDPVQDLKKAAWYINREIERRTENND